MEPTNSKSSPVPCGRSTAFEQFAFSAAVQYSYAVAPGHVSERCFAAKQLFSDYAQAAVVDNNPEALRDVSRQSQQSAERFSNAKSLVRVHRVVR